MSDDATTATAEENTAPPEKTHEETIPYAKWQADNKRMKEANDRAKSLEKQMGELKAQMEERETAGLPELERERKRAEQLEKRASEAEAKAAEADSRLARSQKERWVASAAAGQNFADPTDASAFVNLDDIEDEKDAERAVKRLATQKKHLLKSEEPKIPGRVLENGRTTTSPASSGHSAALEEAEGLAGELAKFLKRRESVK